VQPTRKRYDFSHLSAGDLLRASGPLQLSGRALIRTCICESTIVPMGVTIKLLEYAMRVTLESNSGSG
jgi:adenylate kinase family enzyme